MVKYRAFLSYRHGSEDGAFGARLHRDLERYRVPGDLVGRPTPFGSVPKRLAPIFRDRDDFHAGEGLRAQTMAALQGSDALVVVCSPRAVESPYIAAEIEEFIKLGRGARIIPIILSGEPKDPARTPFPPTLLSNGREVIAADARAESDGYELAKLKVIAGLIGVKLDELRKREAQAQRRRMLAFGTAAVVFAVLSVATAGLAWVAEQRRQVAETERARAERNFTVAKSAASSLVFDIVEGLRHVEGMRTGTVAKILGTADKAIEQLIREAGDDVELQRSQVGMLIEFATTYAAIGDTARQEQVSRRAFNIMDRLTARDPTNKAWQWDFSVSLDRIGNLLVSQGDGPGALAEYRKSLAIRADLVASDPGNTAWLGGLWVSHGLVGDVLRKQGDGSGALSEYRKGQAISERLVLRDPENTRWQRELSVSQSSVGDLLEQLGQTDEALVEFTKSLAIVEGLVKHDPAITEWQRGLYLLYLRIGTNSKVRGNLREASEAVRRAQSIATRLTNLDPNNTLWQGDLGFSHSEAGDALVAQKDWSAALIEFRKRLAVAGRLVARDQANNEWQNFLAVSYGKIGDVLVAQGDGPGALTEYRKAGAIFERLVEHDPANTDWQRGISSSHNGIGKGLLAQGDGPGALAEFSKSLAIAERLVAKDKANAVWLKDLAGRHGDIGVVLLQLGREEEAIAAFEKGRALLAPLTAKADDVLWKGVLQAFDQEIARLKDPLRAMANRVATAYAAKDYAKSFALQNELAAAVIAAETTSDGKPAAKSASALGNLAFFAVLAREPAKALEAAEKSLAIVPGTLVIETNRALALMLLDRVDEARVLFLAHRGKTIPESSNKDWEVVIREDFALLRASGIIHPQMAEIEAAFNVSAR